MAALGIFCHGMTIFVRNNSNIGSSYPTGDGSHDSHLFTYTHTLGFETHNQHFLSLLKNLFRKEDSRKKIANHFSLRLLFQDDVQKKCQLVIGRVGAIALYSTLRRHRVGGSSGKYVLRHEKFETRHLRNAHLVA